MAKTKNRPLMNDTDENGIATASTLNTELNKLRALSQWLLDRNRCTKCGKKMRQIDKYTFDCQMCFPGLKLSKG